MTKTLYNMFYNYQIDLCIWITKISKDPLKFKYCNTRLEFYIKENVIFYSYRVFS